MSCKKGDTYELFFKYIHKSCLLKKWGGNYIYMKQISSWQVFNFLLYRQSSILQDILFYIWYLTICFWIDCVHVYKYTKIKGLDSSTREITLLPESKKSDEHGMSVRSSLKMKCSMKVYNTQPVSHTICPIYRSFAH